VRVIRLIRLMLSMLMIYWLSMCGLFVSHAYAKGWIFANFESIDAKSAITLLNTQEDLVLLDVRTVDEYKEKHLKNAINIPVQKLKNEIHKLDPDKAKRILVYCRSGNRSVKASRILEENAYIPLNIKGGIQQLARQNALLTD